MKRVAWPLFICILLLQACEDQSPTANGASDFADPSPSPSFVPSSLDNEIAETASDGENAVSAEMAVRKLPGAQCLSPWQGSSSSFIELVKSRLPYPSGFEHSSTRLYPPAQGLSTIIMKYRYRDESGSMNDRVAVGTINPANCAARLDRLG